MLCWCVVHEKQNKTKQNVYCIFADIQIHQMTDVGGIHTNKTIFPAEISA